MTSLVALSILRRDGGTQPRDHVSTEVAKDYAEQLGLGAEFPPVVVFFDGTDNWLADGFHRALAHEMIERKEIAADVRQGTRRDAILFSAGANASHGYRRTTADKRRAVLMLLNDAEWSGWSDRAIGRACGVSGPMVATLRPKGDTANLCSEPVRTYQDRYGNTSTMRVGGIGPAPVPAVPAAPAVPLSLVAGRTPNRRPDSRGMPKTGLCGLGTAARITGFSPDRLSGFARDGEIDGADKDGGTWYFDIEKLKDWMKGDKPGPATAPIATDTTPEPEAVAEEPAIPATTPEQQALIQRLLTLFGGFHEVSTPAAALHAWGLFRGQDIPLASVHAAGAWMAEFVARFPAVDAERQRAVEAMLERVEANVIG